MPVLVWLLKQNGIIDTIQGQWADFRFLPTPPVVLEDRIETAIDLYACDLLFIHRDAEKADPVARRQEISDALAEVARRSNVAVPTVCVVPVRMQEAWLLLDEMAIRRSAGNPSGRMRLGLPMPSRVERVPDPKSLLFDSVRTASGHTGRRLAKLHMPSLRFRVAELFDDYSRLLPLPAFNLLEQQLRDTAADSGVVQA